MIGAITTTTRYTPRNHSGPKGIVAPGGFMPRRSVVSPHSRGPVGAPTSARWSATWATAQRLRKTMEGRRSRSSRARMNVHVDRPLRRAESYATRFEKPPTKKKIGMTWKTQVKSQRPGVTPIALVERITPPSQWLIEMNQ